MGNKQSSKKSAVDDAELAKLEKEMQSALAIDETMEMDLEMLDQELDLELDAIDGDEAGLVGVDEGEHDILDPDELQELEGELAQLEAAFGVDELAELEASIGAEAEPVDVSDAATVEALPVNS